MGLRKERRSKELHRPPMVVVSARTNKSNHHQQIAHRDADIQIKKRNTQK
jgi:hypothetical protein